MSMGMCGYAWACMCHKLCVEVRGQHGGLILSRHQVTAFRKLTLGGEGWLEVPLPTKPLPSALLSCSISKLC